MAKTKYNPFNEEHKYDIYDQIWDDCVDACERELHKRYFHLYHSIKNLHESMIMDDEEYAYYKSLLLDKIVMEYAEVFHNLKVED